MRQKGILARWKGTSAAIALLMLLVTAGCAGKHAASRSEPVFWPPAPSAPRVQFLKSINGNLDVIDNKSSFSLFSFGDPEKKKADPLIKPYGIATRNGKIYLCDTGRKTVFVIDLVNKTFESLKGNANIGKMNTPMNLTFDNAGNMLVADTGRQEILMYDPEGNFLRAIGRAVDMKPTDVGVDKNRIFVCDIKHSKIQVFDLQSGKHLESLGIPARDLSLPVSLDIDAEGFLHITNMGTGRVVRMDRDGHVVDSFGKFGDQFGHFGRPKGIALDDQGQTYIVDAAHQNVQVFTEEGRLLMFFGGAGSPEKGAMKLPAGIAVTYDNLDYYQSLAKSNFQLEAAILVSNHFGNNRLSIYGLGKLQGIDYDAEYEMIKKQLEEMAREEKQAQKADGE